MSGYKHSLWRSYISKLLRCPEDIPVAIGTETQKTSMFAAVDTWELWSSEPLVKKAAAIFQLKYKPHDVVVRRAAREIFLHEVFGHEEDLGPELFQLMRWHHSQLWVLTALQDNDSERAAALEAFSVLTRIRLSKGSSQPPLNLALANRVPQLMTLPFVMIPKIPIISFQYFLDVHSTFAFAAIRGARLPHSDRIIAYLYEVLFLQQKIAIALHEFARLAAFAGSEKERNLLINAEVDAIMGADAIFSYLKASVEKTIALVGLAFGIDNLDSKKTHERRLAALHAGIPQLYRDTFYCDFLLEFVKSENIEEINKYRLGLLHKMGIADLQPHNYVAVDVHKLPFRRLLDLLLEQHAKNTAVLLSALALLTDKLVEASPPAISQETLFDQLKDPLTTTLARIARGIEDAQEGTG